MRNRSSAILRVLLLTALGLQGAAPPPSADAPEKATKGKNGLAKLDEKGNVWLDRRDPKRRRVVLKAEVVLREGPLEMLCCLKNTKEHESILAVDAKALVIHTALLAAGARQGKPVQFQPEYRPPTGQKIDVFLEWKDDQDNLRRVRAQQWVRNVDTGKPLTDPWVFAGSDFYEDETSGERYYLAEDGDVICVANFRSAMLDLSVHSSQASGELLFEPFTERIPPKGTPVTLYLEPVAEKEPPEKKKTD